MQQVHVYQIKDYRLCEVVDWAIAHELEFDSHRSGLCVRVPYQYDTEFKRLFNSSITLVDQCYELGYGCKYKW